MKTKRILITTLLLIATVLFSSCSQSNDEVSDAFFSNSSNIYINSSSPNTLSFNIALFSDKKIDQVDYVGLEGENIDSNDYNVNIIDNNADALNNYEYEGLYIKYLMIEIIQKNGVNHCAFQKLILNVDGTRQTLSFDTPVNHEFSDGNVFTKALQISVVPNEFPSEFINDNQQSASYEFEATEDLTLQKIRFNDFLSSSNVVYSIDDGISQNTNFPISLKKGQKIKITFSFMSELANNLSYLTSNIYFDYITDNDNVEHFNSAVIVFDPIYPLNDNDMSNVNKLIESIKK